MREAIAIRCSIGPTRAMAHQIATRLGSGPVGESAADWLSAMVELSTRFKADRGRLQAAGVVDQVPWQIVGLQGGAGDPHSGGGSWEPR